jgi:thiol-disulfide isomerase/thioredoxin
MRYRVFFSLSSILILLGIFGYKLYISKSETELNHTGKRISLTEISSLFDNDKKINLLPASEENNKKSIIHIFASWCRCCKDEIKELKHIANRYDLIGIAWSRNNEETKSWVSKYGNYYKLLGVIEDKEAIRLGISKIPLTLVVDHSGTVVTSLRGSLTLEIFEKQILPYLK